MTTACVSQFRGVAALTDACLLIAAEREPGCVLPQQAVTLAPAIPHRLTRSLES